MQVHTGIQEQTKQIVSSCFLNPLNPNDSFETTHLLLIKAVHVGCVHPGCSVRILSGGLQRPTAIALGSFENQILRVPQTVFFRIKV